jgi:hypothetical protein
MARQRAPSCAVTRELGPRLLVSRLHTGVVCGPVLMRSASQLRAVCPTVWLDGGLSIRRPRTITSHTEAHGLQSVKCQAPAYDFSAGATRPLCCRRNDPIERGSVGGGDQGLGSRRLSVPVDHDIAVEDTRDL